MITLKSAGRLRLKAVPLATAALLIASLTAEGQQRTRPSDSSDSGRSARESGSRSPSSAGAPSTPSGSGRSESSRPPRTARPSDSDGSEARRQRPHTRGDSGSHRRGGYHGGGYYGGYYGPYYGPYGFWPRIWWGYDPYYYPHPYYGGAATYGVRDAGALDLDVSPGRTEVHLDGQYIGTVDAFDGWPRYLWLEKGTYDLVLYLDGYETISRQITVYPGTVIDINDRLEPGESTRPEDLVSKSTTRRDERLRYERERREELERGDGRRGDYGEDWRDRMRRQRDRESDADGRDRDEEMSDDDSSRRGRLLLEVEPEDASVYLDGRFVGTGRELSLMRSGLPVSPGDHKLSIVRPGRRAEEREFTVEAGEDVELEIELESESR
ncbi:MAG TPA: PEGA domain-containing protein [Thermoanaerobaculia bacterium]|nr:PEGA domain-containing protein [Thermoanaerobaculia bacterium]